MVKEFFSKDKIIWIYSPIFISLVIVVGCILWLQCRDLCVNYLYTNSDVILHHTWRIAKKIALIILFFIAFKILDVILINGLFKKSFINLGMEDKYYGISKILKFLLWVCYVVICISLIVGNLTGVIASLGLVGFGITFALQKPILNFVGWLTIVFNGTYKEGDRIKVGDIRGDVKEIQMMVTVLDGLLEKSDLQSGKIVTFPNELVLTTDIQNYTKENNYIVQEMGITITYESDYHKAVKILNDIALNQVEKNKAKYIKRIKKQNNNINQFINKLLKKKKVSKQEHKSIDLEVKKLEEEKKQIEKDIKELETEFKPRIQVELLDSAIKILIQFKAPYDEMKKNVTEINLAFLDEIKNHDDIEIAYPHLELVQKDIFKISTNKYNFKKKTKISKIKQ